MNKPRQSHNRIVLNCYLELKNDKDGKRLMTIMRKYGRKTRDEAITMLKQDAAEKMAALFCLAVYLICKSAAFKPKTAVFR